MTSQAAEIVAMRKAGFGLKLIARNFDICRNKVRRICEQAGLPRGEMRGIRHPTDDELAQLKDMRDNGSCIATIASEMHISKAVVTRWLREAGYELLAPNQRGIDPPEDFASIAATTCNADLVARYGVPRTRISLWRKKTGVYYTDPVNKWVPDTQRYSAMVKNIPRPLGNASDAQAFLQRKGFVPVFRTGAIGKDVPADQWRVGRLLISESEMLDMARRKGWTPDAWKQVA